MARAERAQSRLRLLSAAVKPAAVERIGIVRRVAIVGIVWFCRLRVVVAEKRTSDHVAEEHAARDSHGCLCGSGKEPAAIAPRPTSVGHLLTGAWPLSPSIVSKHASEEAAPACFEVRDPILRGL